MKLNEMIGNKVRRIAATIVAAITTMFSTSAAMATDLENYYFRYDFSDGTKQFIGSARQTSDPITTDADAANFVAAYGQDGAATAVHVTKNAYGSDKIGGAAATGRTVLAGGWTLAMSLRPGSVNKGILFSLGRANANGNKVIFLASSSSSGKLYVGTARRKLKSGTYSDSNTRELAHEWELTMSADLTTGYHTIVASHVAGGTVTVYVDGELAGTVDTTLDCSAATCVFGNGIQFNQAHGTASFLNDVGYSQSLDNPDVAFQDVRFYSSAFTAEDAAAYAALYPATLPGFSNLDAYAYVQSYGVNGVDTGVYMTDTDKFTADFAFTDVSYKSWLCGAGKNANKQTHAIYLNGSKQLAWTTRGEWWWSTWPSAKIEGSTIEDTRLVMTVESSLTANLTYYDTRETKSSDASSKTATSTGPSIIPTHLFRANSMVEEAGQECKAKIYSFEVDSDSSAITPRAFFAPTTDANGAAGFTNVVAGTFHGECLSNPSPALTFTSGVGRAEDYRYRSGKFYSRIYASSADSETGLVKFDGGEAAGTNAQFTARGRTAKIVAVPAEGYVIERWQGDTWAIQNGYSATDSTIEVKSDTAIKLTAVFKSAAQWSNNDGTGSFDNVANWIGGVPPAADDDFTVNISGDTVITVNEAYSLGIMTVKGTGSATFTGTGSISATMLNVASNLTVDTCGKLTVTGVAGAGNVVLTPASDSITISSASTLTGDLTIKADSSVAFNVNAATSVSNFYVRAATNAVVTLTVSGGSFISTETIVKSGVLKQGSATALGNTPKVTVENGGTFDVNGLAPSRSTTFCIAGAGAGDWPWALTSSVNVPDDYKTIDILNLTDNATIGGDFTIYIGVRAGATFYPATQTLPLTLNGHTLTKTGTGTLWFRRPYSTNEGTIDVQAGTLKFSDWSNADVAYGESCVSNIALVVREETTVVNELHFGKSHYTLYFKTLDICGTTMTSSYGAFGVLEELSGHGSIAKLEMGSGAVFKPSGTGYLNVTASLPGTVSVDLSGFDFTTRTAAIPLLQVPASLADTARSSLDLTVPTGWKLKEKTDGGNVTFTLRKPNGVMIIAY